MFNTKIEVVGHAYVVESTFMEGCSQCGSNVKTETFGSFDELVNHLRMRLPIYPPYSIGTPESAPRRP